MLSNQTDLEVFEALRSGNVQALEIFYERYGEVIYNFALRMLGNSLEAKDLTQQVFLALWRGKAYDSKQGTMLTFLITLTRSRGIDCLRQRLAQQKLLEKITRDYPANMISNLMNKASLKEIQERVSQSIQDLSYTERQVLELTYYDGLSQSEVCDHLKIPLTTVKAYKRSALLKLRKMLSDLVD